MRDLQSEPDNRNIPIDKVGVKNLRYPICLSDKFHKKQHTIASINMYVNLPHNFRGTHMSRFVEILNRFHREIAIQNIGNILRTMKQELNAESAHLEMAFPYFILKRAPISGEVGLMEYQCRFLGDFTDKVRLVLEVSVPITTLCPCSKALSTKSAHNQRGIIKVQVRFRGFLWIEDLIELVEDCGSSPVYSLLKREDEKYVTEHAYEHPVFVEDIVRNVAIKLENCPQIIWYKIETESYESIHNHDAYASLEKKIH
ncbi:MAG: GTP cyclohydrolase FolE2 [candidate division WOR-3 bacterium]